jgi:hypothetical protein
MCRQYTPDWLLPVANRESCMLPSGRCRCAHRGSRPAGQPSPRGAPSAQRSRRDSFRLIEVEVLASIFGHRGPHVSPVAACGEAESFFLRKRGRLLHTAFQKDLDEYGSGQGSSARPAGRSGRAERLARGTPCPRLRGAATRPAGSGVFLPVRRPSAAVLYRLGFGEKIFPLFAQL